MPNQKMFVSLITSRTGDIYIPYFQLSIWLSVTKQWTGELPVEDGPWTNLPEAKCGKFKNDTEHDPGKCLVLIQNGLGVKSEFKFLERSAQRRGWQGLTH